LIGFTFANERGETNRFVSMRPAKVLMTLSAEYRGIFSCRYGVTIYDQLGRSLLNIISPEDRFEVESGGTRMVEVLLNPLQLGPGQYTASVSVHKFASLALFNSTPRYDLYGRSFQFSVELPELLLTVSPQFFHSAEWFFMDRDPPGDAFPVVRQTDHAD
jgi:lipopolysaccharide transport system ATP-binding protein